MIVRNLHEAEKTDRRVSTQNWESTRLILKGDEMGYSVHITTIYEGTATEMEYVNHLEAVYCVAGNGKLLDLSTEREYIIEPGTIYALDKHDRHVLMAETELKLVCVFNPPLHGKEVHDASGAYPLEAEIVQA